MLQALQQWVHVETIHDPAQEVCVDLLSCICQLLLRVVIQHTALRAPLQYGPLHLRVDQLEDAFHLEIPCR